MLIYHIVLPEVWAVFDSGLYRHPSLDSEGFIHCSFADQIEGVLGRYYSNESEVVILEIESDRLMSRMIREPSTNREIYPHIYGPINRDAIVAETKKILRRK